MRADPEAVLEIAETFRGLKPMTAHVGAWGQCGAVRRHLLGRNVYMDISFAMEQPG
jgi:hypothetical protein